MANKTWDFTVVYQNPEDLDETPAKRREETINVTATTAKRAISKATAEILDEWEGLEARDLVILDVFRTNKYEAAE